MIYAVEDVVICPMKCDATITHRWYEDEISGDIKKNLGKLTDTMSREEAVSEVRKQYTYLTDEEFELMKCHPSEGKDLLEFLPMVNDGRFNEMTFNTVLSDARAMVKYALSLKINEKVIIL